MIAKPTRKDSPWIAVPRPLVQPRMRLICLPHAGAGASLFFNGAEPLQTAGIELRAVQYPGRENRLSEPLLASTEAMVAAMVTVWPQMSSGQPCALFGHSMGALLAYELAVALARLRVPNPPQRLFISGRNPPEILRNTELIYNLPDVDFFNALT